MTRKKKIAVRLSAILLAVLMLASLFTVAAYADGTPYTAKVIVK